MLFLVSVAYAELPWDCPTFTTPADANALRDTDFGARDAYRAIYNLTVPYQEGCEWVEVVGEGYKVLTDRTCTTALATFVSSEEDYEGSCDGSGYLHINRWQLEVSVPTGETWTKLTFNTYDYSESCGSSSSYGGESYSVAWEGELEGHGTDGELSYASSGGVSGWSNYRYDTDVDTPTCSSSWSYSDDGYESAESVAVSGSSVRVSRTVDGEACHGDQHAYVNGVLHGVVDRNWEYNPDDADRDGSTVPCDCDDADPARNPYIEDIFGDGIDQDCDGTDNLDADGDGHDAQEVGGDDCDDADRSAFPGASEEAGDGIDQDCDGADDVDADGDGYTVDGDSSEADCDDDSGGVHPGAREWACDGIDQDCDGVDSCDEDTAVDTDPDTASFTAERPDEEDDETPPASEREGCAAAAAWLPLLLLGARRRRG
jgi:hypothetical protein